MKVALRVTRSVTGRQRNNGDIMNKETSESDVELYDADPDCDHVIVSHWCGIKCTKCKGWFCH